MTDRTLDAPYPSDEQSWLEKLGNIFSSDPKTRSDILATLTLAAQQDIIDQDAVSIFKGATDVSDMQVREIMIPRSQMVVIKSDATIEELLPIVIGSAHSRFPVIGESTDDLAGILLAKDLLPYVLEDAAKSFDIKKLLRPAAVVPETKRLNVLLREFRENRNHMVVVIDEFGDVAGLATIEDVLEEIVGEIEDEHDVDEEKLVRTIGDGDYIVKALTPIDDFNEATGRQFSDEEFDTIGGIVVHHFGRLPERNEQVSFNDMEFTVLRADNRKVHLVRAKAI